MSSAPPSVLDARVFPDATAAGLAQWAPQAGLVPVLDELTPAVLAADGRIDALVAVERHIAMLQARSAELLAAIDAGDATEDGWARDAVAAALRVPPASMKTRMSDARDLAERLPATLALLRSGEISQRHAAVLVDATRSLPVEKVATVEAAVLGRAPELTATQFRAAVRRAVLRVTDPADEAAAHRDAVAERRVIFTPVESGMTELWAYLSADSAAIIKATLDAMAHSTIHRAGGGERSADQRRADALVDLARTALTDPQTDGPAAGPAITRLAPVPPVPQAPPRLVPRRPVTRLARGHGQRPAVQVTIAASTLMGLDDQPCELDGYGAITAAMARRIAADPTATWRRLLTDDHGHVRHASTRAYRPTAAIIATVIARDQHCQFPGCRRPARYDDLDHVAAWRDGDRTTEANTTSLCRRHHRLKHSGRWRIDRDDTTGITTWTNRAGRSRQYGTRPPDLPTTGPANTGPANSSATALEVRSLEAIDLDSPPF